MTETELERLVVRLRGDSSSYEQMVKTAEGGSKRLQASFAQLEASQKKAETQTKSLLGTLANFSGYSVTSSQLGKGFDALKLKIQETTVGVKELARELKSLSITAAMSTGYFDENSQITKNFIKMDPRTSIEAGMKGLTGIRRNMPTVVRDESSASMVTGEIDIYQRRITERQAEYEAYNESRRAAGRRRAEQVDLREMREKEIDIDRIKNPTKRRSDMERDLDAAKKEAARLRESVHSTKGGGARAEYEKLDSDWTSKMWFQFKTRTEGLEQNPYDVKIAQAKKRLDEEREKLERAEDIERRKAERLSDYDDSRKRNFQDMFRDSSDRLQSARMSPEEERAFKWGEAGANKRQIRFLEGQHKETEKAAERERVEEQLRKETEALKEQAYAYDLVGTKAKLALAEKMKVDPKVIAEFKAQEKVKMDKKGSKLLSDIREDTDSIGLSDFERKMERGIKDLREEGHSEETITGYRSAMEDRKKAQDTEDFADKVKSLVKELNEQAEALKKNDSTLDQYARTMAKADDQQKKAIKNAADAYDKAKMKKTGEDLKDRFGNPRDRYDKEKKELDKLLAAGAIDKDTYQRALANVSKTTGFRGEIGGGSMSVDSHLTNSSEALDTLASFREKAFGSIKRGTEAQKPGIKAVKNAKILMGKLKKTKAYKAYRSNADQARKSREKARENAKTILERIAKAVEKDSEVKVVASGIK